MFFYIYIDLYIFLYKTRLFNLIFHRYLLLLLYFRAYYQKYIILINYWNWYGNWYVLKGLGFYVNIIFDNIKQFKDMDPDIHIAAWHNIDRKWKIKYFQTDKQTTIRAILHKHSVGNSFGYYNINWNTHPYTQHIHCELDYIIIMYYRNCNIQHNIGNVPTCLVVT